MAAIQNALRARGITIVPVNVADLNSWSYYQSDHVHLTEEGHRMIASELLPKVRAALGPPGPAVAQAQSGAGTPSLSLHDACLADAKRLCADVIRDDAKRHECMHEHRAELSKDCIDAIVRSRQ
jgi:hypothetical protein